MARLLALSGQPADIAVVYAGLREADETMRWLEIAARECLLHLITVPADPRFVWLRSHPRFQKLLQHMRLTGWGRDVS